MSSATSSSPALDYSLLVNTTAKEAAPYFLNRMAEKAIQIYGSNKNAKLKMTLAPFPLTKAEATSDNDAAVSGIIIVFYLGVGTSFIPALITNFIVKEKETNIKH
jgi:hypothetical protein